MTFQENLSRPGIIDARARYRAAARRLRNTAVPLHPIWAFMFSSRVNFYLKRVMSHRGSVCSAYTESMLKQYVGTHYTINYSTKCRDTKAVTPAHRTNPSRTSN